MDLSKQKVTFNCPECEFLNSATLGEMSNGGSVICVGCLKTINFTDGDGSTKKAINDVEEAFKDLGKSLDGN